MKIKFIINVFFLFCLLANSSVNAEDYMCSKKLVHPSEKNDKFVIRLNKNSIEYKAHIEKCFEKTKSSKCIAENYEELKIPLIHKDPKDYKDNHMGNRTNIYRQTLPGWSYGDRLFMLAFYQCPDTCLGKNKKDYAFSGKELDCMLLPKNQNNCVTFTKTKNEYIHVWQYDKYSLNQTDPTHFLEVSKCKLIEK